MPPSPLWKWKPFYHVKQWTPPPPPIWKQGPGLGSVDLFSLFFPLFSQPPLSKKALYAWMMGYYGIQKESIIRTLIETIPSIPQAWNHSCLWSLVYIFLSFFPMWGNKCLDFPKLGTIYWKWWWHDASSKQPAWSIVWKDSISCVHMHCRS